MIRKIVSLFVVLCAWTLGYGQKALTQKVSGFVTDAESKTPLVSAVVVVLENNTLAGFTDDEGHFSIENVPVGGHNIKVSLVGYEPKTLSEILVTSGKELVLNITLTESMKQLNEVVVKGSKNASKPLNEFAT